MRAAVLYDIDDLRIEAQAVPQLEAGDLLVQIVASGICSGDLMPWYIRRKAPLVLGHEPAGIVVARGPGEAARARDGRVFALGDRVAIHHHAPCFVCRACLRGDHVQCDTWKRTRIYPGGIAQYVRVPAANVGDTLHLPDHVGFAEAVLVEPLGCVFKSMRRARLRPDDVVYVIGLGVMGLLHIAVARTRGHAVYGSDYQADRQTQARRLGANAAFSPEAALNELRAVTEGRGADVVICGPGSAQALSHAIEACAPGGTVLMFTPLEPGQDFCFDQSAAYFRDISLIASYSCGPDDTSAALAYLSSHQLSAVSVGAQAFAFEDTAEAYRAMRAGEVIKAIIEVT